jgi:hypothetical protein
MLKTRFTYPLPPGFAIVSDNVCHEATFAYRRDPGFFVNVRFVLDWLHYTNHKKCSPAFSPEKHLVFLANKNTQRAEQENAKSAPRKIQLFYCGQVTFLFLLRLHYYWANHTPPDANPALGIEPDDAKEGTLAMVNEQIEDLMTKRNHILLTSASSSSAPLSLTSSSSLLSSHSSFDSPVLSSSQQRFNKRRHFKVFNSSSEGDDDDAVVVDDDADFNRGENMLRARGWCVFLCVHV